MSQCRPCQVIDCPADDPFALYSLQSETYPFVLNCPPGYNCWGGGGYFINLVACEGHVITRWLPPESTIEDQQVLIAQMVAEAVKALPFCSDTAIPAGPLTLYWNVAAGCTVHCPDGLPFTYWVPTGRWLGLTQSAADAGAREDACRQANNHKICLKTLPQILCIGVPQTLNVVASGGISSWPVSNYWTITSGAVPDGMTFQDGYHTGPIATLTGTPTTAGAYTFTVQITAADGCYQSRTYTIHVIDILPATLPATVMTVLYGQAMSINPAWPEATVIWAVTSGSLPDGLTLSTDGFISGVPTGSGGFNCEISATIYPPNDPLDVDITTCRKAYRFCVFESPTALPDGTVGTAYSCALQTAPVSTPTFTVTVGALPDGLVIDGATGLIHGTPTLAGDFSFTIGVTGGTTCSKAFSIHVIQVTYDCGNMPVSFGGSPELNAWFAGLDPGIGPLPAPSTFNLIGCLGPPVGGADYNNVTNGFIQTSLAGPWQLIIFITYSVGFATYQKMDGWASGPHGTYILIFTDLPALNPPASITL